MPQPTTLIRDERLAAIEKWLQDNGWSPEEEYDYEPAVAYTRDVLKVPRRDRARLYVTRAAFRLRGQFVKLAAGRPVKNVKISVEEYRRLINNQKENKDDNSTNGS